MQKVHRGLGFGAWSSESDHTFPTPVIARGGKKTFIRTRLRCVDQTIARSPLHAGRKFRLSATNERLTVHPNYVPWMRKANNFVLEKGIHMIQQTNALFTSSTRISPKGMSTSSGVFVHVQRKAVRASARLNNKEISKKDLSFWPPSLPMNLENTRFVPKLADSEEPSAADQKV